MIREEVPSPNYDVGRPAGINAITIHHWGADGQQHDAVVNHLCNPASYVSAHYVVSGDHITQLVDEENRAWHSYGDNAGTIGIECRPEMDPEDFATVATLISEIRARHGDLPLRGHCDTFATACPGRWYDQLANLSATADKIATDTSWQPGEDIPLLPAAAIGGTDPSTGNLYTDGVAGCDTIGRVQLLLGTPVDGWITGQDPYWQDRHSAITAISYDGGSGSAMVSALQRRLGVQADGILGAGTITALQRRLGVQADGYCGPITVTAWQNMLNHGQAC